MSQQKRPAAEDSYDARGMLAAFREARAPAADDIESLWTRLELDVAVEPLASERRVAAPWRVIVVAATAIAAAFVLGWWLRGMPMQAVASSDPGLANHSAEPESPGGVATNRRVSATAPANVEPRPEPTPQPEPAPEVEPAPAPIPAPEPPPEPQPEPQPERRKRAKPQPTPDAPVAPATIPAATPAAPSAPPPNPTDTLAAEATAIRKARRALTSGSAAAALQQLDAYETRFPHGKLTEEANAVRTMARCAQAPDRAAELAAAFRKRHPASLQQAGVDRACAP